MFTACCIAVYKPFPDLLKVFVENSCLLRGFQNILDNLLRRVVIATENSEPNLYYTC